MAYKVIDNFLMDSGSGNPTSSNTQRISLEGNGQKVEVPDESYVRDAEISRDGMDLVLETSEGTVVIEGYFAVEPTPNLVAPNGATLTPDLVNSFMTGGNQYADASMSMNDASPVGAVQEVNGEVTVTRLDGTVETVSMGTPIFQGDIIETDETGAVNIMFVDETTFAVSEDARLAIDEYVFDPSTQSGTTNFSVLKGVFVFTSGLIGRDDPDDVMIDTPSGSIGIRGTIIAGNATTGEITVIEGAIVLHDFDGNSITLANQFETARFNTEGGTIEHMGSLGAEDVSAKFSSVSGVSGELFSSIQDSASESPEGGEGSEAAPEGEEGANAEGGEPPAGEEIILSGEIVGSGPQGGPAPEGPAPEGPAAGPGGEPPPPGSSSLPPPPPPPPSAPTPFSIQVTRFAVEENSSAGDTVLHIQGQFTSATELSLVGPSNNFFEITGAGNEYFVHVKPGIELDYESPHPLIIKAKNDSGAQQIVQAINLDVLDEDEALTFGAHMPNQDSGAQFTTANNVLTASEGSSLLYDFSQDFHDEDGIISYSLTAATIATLDSMLPGPPGTGEIVAYGFDTNTGNLAINFSNTFLGTYQDFALEVRAASASETISHTYTVEMKQDTFSGDPSLGFGNDDQIYAGTASVIEVDHDNISVFLDVAGGIQNNTINMSGSAAFVKAGRGDDVITAIPGAEDYFVYGGLGDDLFQINGAFTGTGGTGVNGYSYGEAGNDKFHLENEHVVAELETTTAAEAKLNGGTGNDLLHLMSHNDSAGTNQEGNINFQAIENGIIKNIEKIAFIQDLGNGEYGENIVTLDYQSVISMTDDNNILVIDMDSADTLNFINNSADGYDMYYTGQHVGSGSGKTYDIYSSGEITILVDTDAGTVNNIVA